MLFFTYDTKLINLFILNKNVAFNTISIYYLNSSHYNLLVLSCVNIFEYMIIVEYMICLAIPFYLYLLVLTFYLIKLFYFIYIFAVL